MHYVIGFEATFLADTGNLDRAYDPADLARIHQHGQELDPRTHPGRAALGKHIWSPELARPLRRPLRRHGGGAGCQ